MNEQSNFRSNSTGLFTTEDRGQVSVLRFSRSALEDATDLEQAQRLWRFFDGLCRNPKKVLLITMQGEALAIAEEFAKKPADALVSVKRGMIASVDDLPVYLDKVGTGFDDRRFHLGRVRGHGQ
jgi:hypothetical protein